MAVSITVETGLGVVGANSYLSVAAYKAYADAQGYSYAGQTDDQIASALIRATQWIDATHRQRFVGTRTLGRLQGLQWPRMASTVDRYGNVIRTGPIATVVDTDGYPIAINVIPVEITAATAEAAYREVLEPGSLAPDLERGGKISSIQAGPVSITYAGTAPATTTFSKIDGLLSSLIGAPGNGYTGRAVEG